MSVQVQHRRGTASVLSTFTGAAGELLVDTTNNRVVVQDGATAGGFPAAKLAGDKFTGNVFLSGASNFVANSVWPLPAWKTTSNSFYGNFFVSTAMNPGFQAYGNSGPTDENNGQLAWLPNLGVANSPFVISNINDAGTAINTVAAFYRSGIVPIGASFYEPVTVSGVPAVVGQTTGSSNAEVFLNKAASGNTSAIVGETNGLTRWSLALGNGTAESGSNAGSDFALYAFSDAGVAISAPISVKRSTGVVTLSSAPVLPNFTVAGLPVAPAAGSKAFVSDANGPTFLAIVAGGGAIFCPVFYDGIKWRCG